MSVFTGGPYARLAVMLNTLSSLNIEIIIIIIIIITHIIFSSVCASEWPPFGKELLTRLTICSLCMLTICNFSYVPFWF